jgi:hypothetical protein
MHARSSAGFAARAPIRSNFATSRPRARLFRNYGVAALTVSLPFIREGKLTEAFTRVARQIGRRPK